MEELLNLIAILLRQEAMSIHPDHTEHFLYEAKIVRNTDLLRTITIELRSGKIFIIEVHQPDLEGR